MRKSLVSAAQLLCAAMLIGSANFAGAHRAPECQSSVRWIAAEQRLEIVHRLHRHDAESALAQILGRPRIALDTLEARAQFGLYLEQRFELHGDSPLPLALVGAELEGNYLLVYQEYQGPLPRSLSVRSDVLRDVNVGQTNQVLVSIGALNQQLALSDETRWQQVKLPPG